MKVYNIINNFLKETNAAAGMASVESLPKKINQKECNKEKCSEQTDDDE